MDLLYLQHSKPSWPHPVCSARQSEDLTEKKKNIFKAVKKTKIQTKILAAAASASAAAASAAAASASASAASSNLSDEEDCEPNYSE